MDFLYQRLETSKTMMDRDFLNELMIEHGLDAYAFYHLSGVNEATVYNREKTLSSTIRQYECTPAGNRFLRYEVPEEKHIKAILVVLFPYDMEASSENKLGVVDGFSYGYDYHVDIKNKLQSVFEAFKAHFQYEGEAEICVDNGIYIDREIALYGGLGQYGKNQMLFHPQYGSQFFIGYLAFKKEVDAVGLTAHHIDLKEIQIKACQTCSKCEVACPVHICSGENSDASKCVGMLTQTKRPLSMDEKKAIGRQLYGCSICQKVCPLNRKKPLPVVKIHTEAEGVPIDVKKILLMNNRAFKATYGHMAFSWRSLWVYKRNALINMGNFGRADALEFLKAHPHLGEDENLSGDYFWAISEMQKRLK